MNDTPAPRRSLHLVVDGLLPLRRRELEELASRPEAKAEIFALTETNGRAALEKIFAADAVAVWGPLLGED